MGFRRRIFQTKTKNEALEENDLPEVGITQLKGEQIRQFHEIYWKIHKITFFCWRMSVKIGERLVDDLVYFLQIQTHKLIIWFSFL